MQAPKLGAWGSDMFVGSTFTIRGSKRLEWQQSFVILVLSSLSTYRFYYYKGFEVAYKHQRFIVKKYPSTPPESEGNNWNMMRWHYKPSYWCNSFWYIFLLSKSIGSLIIICWHLLANLLDLWLQCDWQVIDWQHPGEPRCSDTSWRLYLPNMECACCFEPVPKGS